MGNPERKRKEQQDIEAVIEQVADYMKFEGFTEEELSEEDLELVSAARTAQSYAGFLRRLKEEK